MPCALFSAKVAQFQQKQWGKISYSVIWNHGFLLNRRQVKIQSQEGKKHCFSHYEKDILTLKIYFHLSTLSLSSLFYVPSLDGLQKKKKGKHFKWIWSGQFLLWKSMFTEKLWARMLVSESQPTVNFSKAKWLSPANVFCLSTKPKTR